MPQLSDIIGMNAQAYPNGVYFGPQIPNGQGGTLAALPPQGGATGTPGAYAPPTGSGPSTLSGPAKLPSDPFVAQAQQPSAAGPALLPLLAQLQALMGAGSIGTQAAGGTGQTNSPLFTSTGAGGTSGVEAITRLMGMMPWLGGAGMNPFSGGGQSSALSRMATPLFDKERLLGGR